MGELSIARIRDLWCNIDENVKRFVDWFGRSLF